MLAQVRQGGAGVRVVEQAVVVLRALADTPSRSIREFARDLDISKSTAQRILVSLERTHLVQFDPRTELYSLGPGVLGFAAAFQQTNDLVVAAQANLRSVWEATHETVSLTAMVDEARVVLCQLESPLPLRLSMDVGQRYPLQTGATGRAVLSLLDDIDVERLIAGNWPLATIVPDNETRARLRAALAEVKSRGYALSREEWLPGGGALAVPVPLRAQPAALTIYAPLTRFTDDSISAWVPLLQRAAIATAAAISRPDNEVTRGWPTAAVPTRAGESATTTFVAP